MRSRGLVSIALLSALVGGVAVLAREISPQRVVFGSHFPLFYFESAALKMREAGFSDADAKAISEENALRLIGA